MKIGIGVFPGSNCDRDAMYAFKCHGAKGIDYIHYGVETLSEYDMIILPGGFSFGDYLRTGAIAVHSELFSALPSFIAGGGLVLGVCNGFQMLVESGLLPGFLLRNREHRFISKQIHLRVEDTDTPFTYKYSKGDVLRMPIAHTTGNYQPAGTSEKDIRVIFRYCDEDGNVSDEANPNGSHDNIAAISDPKGRVLGMMPHFERVCDPILGESGIPLIKGILEGGGNGNS